jgi:hypothetical protein
MAIELQWIASRSASCFHAARAIVLESAGESSLAAALAPAARALGDFLAARAVPADVFFDHLVPLSAGIEADRDLAELTLRKTLAPRTFDTLVLELALRLKALKQAQTAAIPRLVDELELRSGPLREQWEARGPGLWAGLGRLTETGLLVEQATVALVYPLRGGGGRAHVAYNMATIEAVLANPVNELPEIVRLGWLLSMLNLDLPKYSERLRAPRRVFPLAMLPAVLTAAENVELARFDPSTMRLAIDAWRIDPAGRADDVVDTLGVWWQTYRDTRPPWDVALAALERMLEETTQARPAPGNSP